jgi:hypothetical protein
MANFLRKFSKIRLLDTPALFFCRQVPKIRHKKLPAQYNIESDA